jgi:hypothetical protein
MVGELRRTRLERDEKIREYRERTYGQFYRCLAIKKKLMDSAPHSAEYDMLKLRLSRGWRRLESMRRRLAGMKTGASNRQVAEVLESAKGTVDAHLSMVKAKWPPELDRSFGDDDDDDGDSAFVLAN